MAYVLLTPVPPSNVLFLLRYWTAETRSRCFFKSVGDRPCFRPMTYLSSDSRSSRLRISRDLGLRAGEAVAYGTIANKTRASFFNQAIFAVIWTQLCLYVWRRWERRQKEMLVRKNIY
jgi:hypothetical protein